MDVWILRNDYDLGGEDWGVYGSIESACRHVSKINCDREVKYNDKKNKIVFMNGHGTCFYLDKRMVE